MFPQPPGGCGAGSAGTCPRWPSPCQCLDCQPASPRGVGSAGSSIFPLTLSLVIFTSDHCYFVHSFHLRAQGVRSACLLHLWLCYFLRSSDVLKGAPPSSSHTPAPSQPGLYPSWRKCCLPRRGRLPCLLGRLHAGLTSGRKSDGWGQCAHGEKGPAEAMACGGVQTLEPLSWVQILVPDSRVSWTSHLVSLSPSSLSTTSG